jgi:hypothetical protein
METLNDLAFGLLSGLAYGLAGIVLLGLGFIALDLVTPGKLGDIVFNDRNPDAALVVASGVLAIGTIVTTAIVTSDDAFLRGLSNVPGTGCSASSCWGSRFSWSTSSPRATWARC